MSDHWLAIVGVVLGLLAIAIAVPPLLQMVFGRPKLEFKPDEFMDENGKMLLLAIKNKPTANRFLRRLGVEREMGNVLAYFDIQEQGSRRFFLKDISARVTCAATREQGLLARALPLFTSGVMVLHNRAGIAGVIDGRHDDLRPIGAGHYTAIFTIVCGEQVHKFEKNFTVADTEAFTIWV
jgi:hypothetical protein